MGCAHSTAQLLDELKEELDVTSGSTRGQVWPGLEDLLPHSGSIDLVVNYNKKDECSDVCEVSTGKAFFKVKTKEVNGYDQQEFLDMAGNLVALKEKPTTHYSGPLKMREHGHWNFWSARPALEGQTSEKTHAGVPLYLWGLFRCSWERKPWVIDYVEVSEAMASVSDKDSQVSMRKPSYDGTAALVSDRNDKPVRKNSKQTVYGPGTEKTERGMVCGKPVAFIDRLRGPFKFTMAARADPILLLAMSHCESYAKMLDDTYNGVM